LKFQIKTMTISMSHGIISYKCLVCIKFGGEGGILLCKDCYSRLSRNQLVNWSYWYILLNDISYILDIFIFYSVLNAVKRLYSILSYSNMVIIIALNDNFNNFSVISYRSVLLVKEIGVPGENHRPQSSCHAITTPTAPLIQIIVLLNIFVSCVL
jgi:hypothetical protein